MGLLCHLKSVKASVNQESKARSAMDNEREGII